MLTALKDDAPQPVAQGLWHGVGIVFLTQDTQMLSSESASAGTPYPASRQSGAIEGAHVFPHVIVAYARSSSFAPRAKGCRVLEAPL